MKNIYRVPSGKWMVRIRDRYIGRYSTYEEAKEVATKAAIEMFGEFARPTGDVCDNRTGDEN